MSGRGPVRRRVGTVTQRGPNGSDLRAPVMIAAFEGWNDAGDAASAAVEQLGVAWEAEPLAELDPEGFYDFQVTRPTVRLIDGVTRTIDWPTTRLTVCRLPSETRDVILVHGIEPNFRWRAFCDELVAYALDYGVETVVCLGALLADVPHTRPVQVSGSAHDEATAERHGIAASRYEGAYRDLGGVLGRLRAGRHSVVVLLGGGPHTMFPRPPRPRPRSHFCTGWRRCLTSRCRWASYRRRPTSGRSR